MSLSFLDGSSCEKRDGCVGLEHQSSLSQIAQTQFDARPSTSTFQSGTLDWSRLRPISHAGFHLGRTAREKGERISGEHLLEHGSDA